MDNNKEKVLSNKGPETLSKKERRALKVQEKQVEKPAQDKNEKELRRLEWERKLAEQKAGTEKKELSKSELKAKRREQQEAQRNAKEQKPKPEAPKPVNDVKPVEPKKIVVAKKKSKSYDLNRLQICNHLYLENPYADSIINYKNIHPVFVRLGVQFSSMKILGSNARCLALLSAVKHLINDLQTPPKQEFCRYLEQVLQTCVDYLSTCRPLAASMSNALRHFKTELLKATTIEENTKKETMLENIDTYIYEEIDKAGEAISLKVNEKIVDGDVILTYGCSSIICKILEDAHHRRKNFEVIVVDGRPLQEGREMLRRISQTGIKCTYIQINAVSYVMEVVTKVLLGAHALLTNGYVMSRIGTAQVALVAQAYNKPVLVCCETYKFSEQVLTDSFVYNELGNDSKLIAVDTLEEPSPLLQAQNDPNLQILNLLYDVTPPDLITAVVTEIAILPCTSAPVVLRIKP